jgi:hypothetical protein
MKGVGVLNSGSDNINRVTGRLDGVGGLNSGSG